MHWSTPARIAGFALLTALGALVMPGRAAAATRTWDGGGATGNWSEAANWSDDVPPGPGDVAVFDGTSPKDAVIDAASSVQGLRIDAAYTGTLTQAAGADLVVGNGLFASTYDQSGGTFRGGAASITFSFTTFTLTGGVFDLGGSTAVFFSSNLTLAGGRFIASSGTMNVSGNYRRSDPAAFEHNNGTLVVGGNVSWEINGAGAGTDVLNNLTVDNPDSFNSSIGAADTVRVIGSLDLVDGDVNGGTLEAQGPVTIASTFGFSSGAGGGTLLITGPPRTITLPTGMGPFLNLVLDAAGTTLDTSGPGPITLKAVTLRQGTIETGPAAFAIGAGINAVEYIQSGGTFHAGGGPLTLPFVTFTLTGGVFDIGASNAVIFSSSLTLTGGRFIASSGTMRLSGNYRRSDPATFEHNNGSVIANGNFSWELNGAGAGTEVLNNFTVDTSDGFNNSIGAADTVRVIGSLDLINGDFNGGRMQAEGPVSVATTFDGGAAAFAFGGAADQAYVNAGGPNLTGVWTVDKPAGTVALASDLNLSNGTAGFLLASGTITTGVRVVDIGTRPVTRTNGHVIGDLRRTLTTTGTKTFDVGTASGYSPVSVNVTALTVNPSSLTVGARQGAHPLLDPSTALSRFWPLTEAGDLEATLVFNYLQEDVNGNEADYKVARIAGGEVSFLDPPAATIDVANNRATVPGVTDFSDAWTLGERPAPPPPLSIDPGAATVAAAATQAFTAAGGVPPYVFSLPVNNSGGSVDAATGLYTAGTLAGVTDTVRVTDSLGAAADATVNVVAGTASRLAFRVQPTNVVAGAVMVPPVRIAVEDSFGNVVTTATGPVSISFASNPGGATLSGTLTVTPGAGVATFGDLGLDRAATGYTFIATAAALTPATSGAFDVAPDVPARLAFAVQPTSVAVSLPIAPPVEVAVQDRFGNATSATNAVTLVLASNPSGGVLAGTLTRNAAGGIAAFDDLTVDRPGSGYTLLAMSGGLTAAISAPFDVLVQDLVVTSTGDAGPGSLRQAILDANARAGRETIRFDIPGGGPHTIRPLTVLPRITSPIVIDGSTQPGYGGTPLIELDGVDCQPGSTGADGLDVAGGDSVIKALAINRFTGSGSDGIALRSSGNTIQGCYLGVGVDGATARGNQFGLRAVFPNDGNLIGGPEAIDRNVISGNLDQGLLIYSSFNEVIGNLIGTSADGSAAVPNGAEGILLVGPNAVGDSSPGMGNRIAFNGGMGIAMPPGSRVRGNSIHSNQGLGIDIFSDGVTPNDPGDGNPGQNAQNFPVLNAVLGSPGAVTVQGTLDSKPSSTFTLDFYASSACDPSGHGEGETPLGSTTVTTDGAGQAGFTATLPTPLAAGTVVTATATNAQEKTSEFSPCQRLGDATLFVTNTSDDGPGSLRKAIEDANTATGVAAIHFDIPGPAPFTIAPAVRLPTILGHLVLDGTTQPGYAGTPLVRIDASRMVGGCEEGLKVAGSNDTIKGLAISGCRSAVPLASAGIRLEGTGGHTIQGCHIGTGPGGPNTVGIMVASSDNRIGGSTSAERNVISGNSTAGIALDGSGSIVQGNFIGTNASGTAGGGPQAAGVSCLSSGGTGNIIGGTSPGSGNVIAFNSSHGVRVECESAAVRGNSIFANGGLGIDLGPDGVTPNDDGDGDLGPNGLQNFPILSGVSSADGVTAIQGRLSTTPATTYTLDFYASAGCDPSGNGEGQTLIGSSAATTDAAGIADFLAQLPATLTSVTFVTATATDPQGNTSEFSPCRRFGSVLAVRNTLDAGPGSLRQALLDANASPLPDLIVFRIASTGPVTITPLTPLPAISGSVVIDGTSQRGYAGTPLIQITGNAMSVAASCLVLDGGRSTIKGLAIGRCGRGSGAGLQLQGSGGHTVQACHIGTDPGGTAARGNFDGIVVRSSGNLIGGLTPADQNLISGNRSAGISVVSAGPPSSGNVIQGNRIGTDITGKFAVPNGVGVKISASSTALGRDAGNRIHFNRGDGVVVSAGTGNALLNNSIRLNGGAGVRMSTSGTTVGGVNATGNAIDSNSGSGVVISEGTGNLLRGNGLHSNGGLEIDLGADGVTANDAGDADNGANDLQNFPALSSAASDGASTTVEGTLDSRPARTYALDFYANASCDPSGHGPGGRAGARFLGSSTVTLGSSGSAGFTAVLPNGASAGQIVTAIATDVSGNTSEFSACVPVGAQGPALEPPSVPSTGIVEPPGGDEEAADSQERQASPLRGRIALAGARQRIHVMNADGSGLVAVTAAGARQAGDFDPRFSRDGRKVSFRRVRVGPLGGQLQHLAVGEIHVMNADGSDLRRVTDNSAAESTDAGPAWSPDGSRIAFVRAPAGRPGTDEDLMVMKAGGSVPASLLGGVPSGPRAVDPPDWSPDGTRIAFSMSFDGSHGRQIFLVDPDGENLTALTSGIPGSLNPAWSPDGAQIAFLKKAGGGGNPFDVFVMNADGQDVSPVAAGALGDRLAWSPDGTMLAYVRRAADTAAGNELVIVSLDGAGPLVVASGPLSGPAWSGTVRTETPSGTEVEVREGATAVTFAEVSAAGLTTVIPIPAAAAGSAPGGFRLGGIAFEITTSAAFTPPVTVCSTVAPTSEARFEALALLHDEAGVLVDRTTRRDFASRTVCGTVDELGIFALAEAVVPGAP